MHVGTWHGMLESMRNWRKIDQLTTCRERLQLSPIKISKWPVHYESRSRKWYLRKNSVNSHTVRISQSDMAVRSRRGEPALAVSESVSFGGLFLTIVAFLVLTLVFVLVQVRFIDLGMSCLIVLYTRFLVSVTSWSSHTKLAQLMR